MAVHKPVLTKEVLKYLDPKPGENIIDATIGEGGHTLEIIEKVQPDGRVLGVDWDAGQIEQSRANVSNYGRQVILECDTYANIVDIAARHAFNPVNGILLDLGYSSRQVDQSDRGFSFQQDALLDMRYSLENPVTAEMIVNEYSEHELERIFREYGQEKFAKRIAKQIVADRVKKRISSTFALRDSIEKAIGVKAQHGKIHYATRVFQALRIAVNAELDNLQTFLPKAIELLAPNGRLVVISFHSLEDRIVKQFFKEQEQYHVVTVLTKKPVMAQASEVAVNPRARSAKLRAMIRT